MMGLVTENNAFKSILYICKLLTKKHPAEFLAWDLSQIEALSLTNWFQIIYRKYKVCNFLF